jgi:hypothetical protein
MEIDWYSPAKESESAIAWHSKKLLPFLNAKIDVRCFSDGVDCFNHDNCKFDSERDSCSSDVLSIYHIGNNSVHVDIFRKAKQNTGIIILHDLNLIDLARSYERDTQGDFLLSDALHQQYGREAVNYEKDLTPNSLEYQHFLNDYPLFLSFIASSLGVIVHSDLAYKLVSEVYGGPMLKLGLPAYSPIVNDERVSEYSKRLFNVMFCGHCGPNRRLYQFVEAWAEVSEPSRFRLKLYGNVGDVKGILNLAAKNGLSSYINIAGFVSEDELDAAMSAADIAINMRFPTMGEASASQLRYMGLALPTMVSDIGWYSDLPDEAVIKIPIDDELAAIKAGLEKLLADPSLLCAMANNCHQYLEKEHSIDSYVSGMCLFIEKTYRDRFVLSQINQNFVPYVAELCNSVDQIILFDETFDVLIELFSED